VRDDERESLDNAPALLLILSTTRPRRNSATAEI
jgi:hypothetical protein